MNEFSKDEGLFHELHVPLGLKEAGLERPEGVFLQWLEWPIDVSQHGQSERHERLLIATRSMGLALDIDLERGAGRIEADLGRLFAKLGPKGIEAGLEVVRGVAVDGREKTGPHLVLVRAGSKLVGARHGV